MSQFIATTPLLNMRPVGSAAERSLPRLQAILEREFKGKIGLRLAEPVARADGSGIDWYAETDDQLTQLTSLPDELADYYRKRLQAEVSVIAAAAGRYEEKNDQAARTTAAALRNAICHPGDEFIWLGGDVPSGKASIILTAWGYEPRSSELTGSHTINRRDRIFPATQQVVIDQNLPHEGEAVANSTSTSALANSPQRDWLRVLSSVLWAFALILPFVIGWMLLPACGVRMPFSGTYVFGWGDGAFCRQIADPQIEAKQADAKALTTELASLTDQVRGTAMQCVPVPSVDPVDEVRKRVTEAGVELNPNETTISLLWNNTHDLDLYVICPNGKKVAHDALACGGRLEIDRNYRERVDRPIEHVRFGESALMPGRYGVEVKYFGTNESGPPTSTPFEVVVEQKGKEPIIKSGVVQDEKEIVKVMEFTVP
ncbi:hypothetical protein FA04_03040 [Ensifer adhaerens]|uniref:Uncharacterized protein n=1 Tax=Ensifer adhaerens TaxID=106592 RepID=A0ABY8HIQ6_ENSAD|nr:hypothetical protein [Ensifer adhaerens]ANK71698.1 hypothetical protein FA04_03040 [Ensifer adhaerens]KDP71576.1 hypothetical protein FA04_22150 [Ensifer adhaerens]WFP91375.1 hypothetical protein P4B07_03065 [Ensifer adhaerens]